jgi:hypothetical protein
MDCGKSVPTQWAWGRMAVDVIQAYDGGWGDWITLVCNEASSVDHCVQK